MRGQIDHFKSKYKVDNKGITNLREDQNPMKKGIKGRWLTFYPKIQA